MRCCNNTWFAVVVFSWLLLQPAFAATPVVRPSLKAALEAATADQTPVLAIFSAQWCGPCKLLKRTLAASDFLEHAGALQVTEIDVDADVATARVYNIEALPTLVLLSSDSKIISRREGYMEPTELLSWLREGRQRIKEGQWEGTAPGAKLAPFVARAAADQLDTNDLARLVALLGEPDPADRQTAANLLLEQREQAVAALVEALTNSYLAVRIGACETLLRLAPDAPAADPWQSPTELAPAVAALQTWWRTTEKLPPQPAARVADSSAAGSIVGALDLLRGNNPVRRTAAMSTLVGFGASALPAVREALRLAEKNGDQRSLGLLEDVRWAVLIPDSVEQRVEGTRRVLAAGKGPDRQAAATRLGKIGPGAIPALVELANDADPLVIEAAVRALSNLGGKDAIPAMVALLKAADPNLRMTAAQALGHSKNPAATRELVAVFDDPNEVVVCAALSALDEIHGERDYSNSKRPQSPEVIQGLRRCLADPRWRVRATAAEVTGKLSIADLTADLIALLSDTDGFVVKNALESLQKLGGTPEPQKLLDLAQSHPELRAQTVEWLVNWQTDEAVKTINQLYSSSAVDGRIAIVQSLGAGSRNDQKTNAWQPLLRQAAADPEARLRRAVAQNLAAEPPNLAAALVGPLLSDEDPETRVAAAGVVLSVIGRERQVIVSSHRTGISEFMSVDDDSSGSSRKKAATNAPAASLEQIAAWHETLRRHAAESPGLLPAVARYVTGPTNDDLQALQAAIDQADKSAFGRLSHSAALAALVPRLPWPEGKPMIERFSGHPALFLKMLGYLHTADPAIRDFLLDPQRFRAAVDPVSADELATGLERLLEPQQSTWTLFSSEPHTVPIISTLLEATNAAWRAAAVYSLGIRDEPKAQASIEHALGDSNAWVRAAAASSLIRVVKDRAAAERLLGPLLSDHDKKVAEVAAIGLLEPETRVAANLDYASSYFEFEKVHVWSGAYEPTGEQRPLATVQGNPAFLEVARQKVATGAVEEAALPALLLAQYGDFAGLDHLLRTGSFENQPELENLVLAAIGLTRDAKYLTHVRKMVVSAQQEQDFRHLLQALRGMSGPEARELRLEINKHLRQGRE